MAQTNQNIAVEGVVKTLEKSAAGDLYQTATMRTSKDVPVTIMTHTQPESVAIMLDPDSKATFAGGHTSIIFSKNKEGQYILQADGNTLKDPQTAKFAQEIMEAVRDYTKNGKVSTSEANELFAMANRAATGVPPKQGIVCNAPITPSDPFGCSTLGR